MKKCFNKVGSNCHAFAFSNAGKVQSIVSFKSSVEGEKNYLKMWSMKFGKKNFLAGWTRFWCSGYLEKQPSYLIIWLDAYKQISDI